MRFNQLENASRLATKLTSLTERHGMWAKVDLTTNAVARRINANGSTSPDRLPMVDDDTGMHIAIVEAILKEYDERIAAVKAELMGMGVEL